MKISPVLSLSAVTFMLAAGLSGCTSTVSLEPAADANEPACADVMVRLPDNVSRLARRDTNAQSTAAWGNPTSVIFRCGLPEVTASTLPCVTTSEVDWLVDESQKPKYRFITFARKPAIEVIVDSEKATGVSTLDDLASAIQAIEPTKNCIG